MWSSVAASQGITFFSEKHCLKFSKHPMNVKGQMNENQDDSLRDDGYSQKYTAMASESRITRRRASPAMSSMKSAVGSFSVSSHDRRFSSFFMSPVVRFIVRVRLYCWG